METESLKTFANVPVVWEPGPGPGRMLRNIRERIESKYAIKFNDYWTFHKWSVDHLPEFWAEIWDAIGIVHSNPFDQVIDLSIPLEQCPEWFRGAKLNFAENLLRFRDNHPAIISAGEDKETETVTYAEMYEEVQLYAAALKKCELKKGDRAVCYMSNRQEPVFACIGVTSIGAIWTGALPLLGAQAVLNRFVQVEPKILFTIDRFRNDGEEIEMLQKVKEIVDGLPSLTNVVVVPSKRDSKSKDISCIRNSCWLDEFLALGRNPDGSVPPIKFEQVSVNHPIFISYTSGTTGLPKALVHGSGLLLTAARDFGLHTELNRKGARLSMSPVGWASWNIMTTLHFVGLTALLYEGVPYFLTPTYLWDMVDKYELSNLFLPTNVLDELQGRGYLPTKKHKLTSLMTILSGGSVVKPQNYDFVYEKIKKDVIFTSMYVATEMMATIMLFDDSLKIHRGELTCPSLGTDIEIIDDTGKPVVGEAGEIVITKPTPSFPIGIWGDTDGSRYRESYFSKVPGKFAMGDLGLINPVTKGYIIYGRSDATLKPGGCRFGSSEIYNIVETFFEIQDSICVSQYSPKGIERAVLFLKMKSGQNFSEDLISKIRSTITRELSSSHVPEIILSVPDIPYSVNGKKLEVVVKNIINNRKYNPETVINPECLKHFSNISELSGY
ncbi:acetoacetyl-CoA synthetase-like [Uloborus diversus]|uniref:acetoacetyl-CoA synthetase-like n=1 Tax=Uloborus diversus TaxID=327109 RepID=UPI002409F2CB|nr:acetoacetyl-CoA synthetase-like [Uloborus diversus]